MTGYCVNSVGNNANATTYLGITFEAENWNSASLDLNITVYGGT